MEEHKEDKNTEYTGEYGNTIQGEYQEDTTYRYSYSDSDESTHSGDYYGGTQDDSTGTENQENVQSSKQDDIVNGETLSGEKQQMESSVQNQSCYTNQSTYYHQNQNSQGYPGYQGGSGFTGQSPKPPKKTVSFGKKLLVTVACAVVFGLVAGVCFNGFNFVVSKVGNRVTGNQTLEKTTVNSGEKRSQSDSKTEDGTESASKIEEGKDVAAIAEQTMPAVVAITSTSQGADYYDLFGQYYQGQESSSSGTGFIVGQNDKELLIATNNHVVDGAKTISVQFIDGEIYEAKEKGSDSANDLAVIAVTVSSVKKTTMDKIKIADMGNSDKAKVGEMVIAIGNALGYGQSVTVGYISAKDREISEADESGNSTGNKIKALQTDAAINPGNSGGALINMQGQVIGINSAKIASSSVEGVGYAIPISVATPIIDELMNKEILSDDEKGYLGISGTEVTQDASVYNMPYGVYVKEVAKGGAAEEGGIKAGDVITAVNKVEVTTMTSLQEKISSYRKGTKVQITVKRSNNGTYQEKKLTVKLQGKESLDSLSDGSSSTNDGSNNSGSGNNDSDNGNNDSNNGNNGSGNGNNGSDNGNGGFNNDNDDSDGDGFGSFWDFFR